MNSNRFVHYRLDIPELDDEHWELFLKMSQISDLAQQGQIEQVKSLLDQLCKDMLVHYEHEEKFMESINFPYYEYHVKAHRVLYTKMQKMIGDVDSHFYIDKWLGRNLEEIFMQHLDHMDRQVGEFVKKNASP